MHPLIARTVSPRAVPARGESGFILVMTLMLLVVLIGLVGTVGVSAIDAGNTSNQVTLRDRAYAVADAGLQTALFRLNQDGGATGATGTLGSGASYSYTVSALTTHSSSCAGLWVQSSGQAVQQDCITSTGSVGGYSTKVQDRIVAYTPVVSPFPVNGIFAVNSFTVGQNFTDTSGDIGSNGPISFGGGASVNGKIEYLSQYPPSGITCTNTCTPVVEPSAITVPSNAATAPSAYAAAAASNKDATITAATWSTDDFTYTPATQQVSGGNGSASPVTFQPGTYYYCDFSANSTNGVELDAAASATASNPVIIYIDSPSRSGSTCASGTGNFSGGKNNMTLDNLSGIGGAFQIYVYGTPGCTTSCPSVLSMNNGTYTDVDIYAPNSQYSDKNNSSLTGDFVIGSFNEGNNASFTYQSLSGGTSGGSTLPTYYPSAQQICTTGSTC
jgi:hypothetical protein